VTNSCKQHDVKDDIVKFWMKYMIKDDKVILKPNHINTIYVAQICNQSVTILLTYQNFQCGDL
jgi:hypothetical protein